MNARYRLRVWDESRKRFHYGCSNIMLDLNGTLYWQFGYSPPYALDPKEAKSYTLEQWTGENDADGTPIFEGDILVTRNADPAYDIWDQDANGLTTVVWWEQGRRLMGSEWTWDKGDESIFGLQFVHVVGNIHQKKEE